MIVYIKITMETGMVKKIIYEDIYCPHCLEYYKFYDNPMCSTCGKEMLIDGEYLQWFHMIEKKVEKCSSCGFKKNFNKFHRFCPSCGHEELVVTDLYKFVRKSDFDEGLGVEQWKEEMGTYVIHKYDFDRYNGFNINGLTIYSEFIDADIQQIKDKRRGVCVSMNYRLETIESKAWVHKDMDNSPTLEYKFVFKNNWNNGSFEKIDNKWEISDRIFDNVAEIERYNIVDNMKDKELLFESFWSKSIFKNVKMFQYSPKKHVFFIPQTNNLFQISLLTDRDIYSIGTLDDMLEYLNTDRSKYNYNIFILIGNEFIRKSGAVIFPMTHIRYITQPKRALVEITNEEFKEILKDIFYYSWKNQLVNLIEETNELKSREGTKIGFNR